MTDLKKLSDEAYAAALKQARWHYMDEKTVAGYGPWVRAVDYDEVKADLAASLAREVKLREALLFELPAKSMTAFEIRHHLLTERLDPLQRFVRVEDLFTAIGDAS